jgi:hypothetical protein
MRAPMKKEKVRKASTLKKLFLRVLQKQKHLKENERKSTSKNK